MIRSLAPWFAPVAVCLLGGLTIRAAEPEWKVGLAQIKITPDKPLFLAGYASRNKPYEKIENDIFAKAMVLEDAQKNRAVLVTADLIGFTAEVAEPICDRLREKLGLKREQILLNVAHIHTGPVLSLNAQPRGKDYTAGDAQRTIEYTRGLQDKIVEVVTQAAAKLEPVQLSWGGGVAHFVMNRREFTPNGVILGANPRGLADRTVPVLRIDSLDGKPRAILFGAAVHNTTLRPQHNVVCGDYAGFAQVYVQEKHPSAQAMFMLGCAGDADPYPHGSMELTREHGATLGKEVCRVMETKLKPVRGPLRIAFDRAELPLQQFSKEQLQKTADQTKGMQQAVAKQMLEVLERGDKLPVSFRCPFTVWQFGADLTLVGLSGEVVVDYVTLLEKALGPNQLWVAAYCNDVFGYVPSARVLAEGGYETRGIYTGGPGLFDAKTQDVIVDKVRELAKKAGREPRKTDAAP